MSSKQSGPTSSSVHNHWQWLLRTYNGQIVLICAAGALLRLAWLGAQPLWRDEAFTALVVRRSIPSMLSAVSHDSAPPLAYLLQHFITQVVDSPTTLRLVSALAGVAEIAIGAAIGRRIAGDKAGLWCAVVFAILPSTVLASRDARMYELAATLALASTLAGWRLVEQLSVRRAVVYAVIVAAALYTNYFAAIAVAGQLAGMMIALRVPRRNVFVATVCAAVAVLTLIPWLIAAKSQFQHGSAPFWVQPIGVASIFGVFVQFFSGPPVDAGVPAKLLLQTLQGVAVIAGCLSLIALYTRMHRHRDWPARRTGISFLTVCSLGSLLLLVIASLWRPLVEARYTSVFWGPMICLIGLGASTIPWRKVVVGAPAIAVISVTLGLAPTHPDTPALLAQLNGRVGPHDLISSAPGQYLLLLYYGDQQSISHTHIVSSGVDWFWGTAAYPPDAVVDNIPAYVTEARGTIYYIDEPNAVLPQAPSHYTQQPTQCFSTTCLTVYRPSG